MPFLAQIPEKYREDPVERAFWDYLIRVLDDVVRQSDITDITAGGESVLNDPFSESGEGDSSGSAGVEELGTYNEPSIFRAVSVSVDFDATDRDFVLANNGATIEAPASPPEGSVFRVSNADGSVITVSGNGRPINGETNITMQSQYLMLEFYYFIASDEWVIS